jgi:hypothetical protein
MPRLLGMEPETVQKVKPFLLIGGGGLILFLVLKGRSTPAVAAEAPTQGQVPAGVVSPAAAGDLSQSGSVVSALQAQMQQHQDEYDVAAGNLALQGQAQQLQFQQQQQTYSLARQQSLDAQQDAVTHEQFKQLKNQGKTGGFLGSVFRNIGEGLGIYTQLQGAGIVQRPAQPTQHVSTVTPKAPAFNPGPWGGGF